MNNERWFPLGATRCTYLPEPGTLLAIDHAVWKVAEVGEPDQHEWTDVDHTAWMQHNRRPFVVTAYPVDQEHNRWKIRGRARQMANGRLSGSQFYAYPDEHYPVCASCSEPLPCRETERRRLAEQELRQAEAWQRPGVCPACGQPVTTKQDSMTFPNVKVPGGPLLTFHIGRQACRSAARDYAKQAAEQGHEVGEVPTVPKGNSWRGKANRSQRTILENAAAGQLVASLGRVYDFIDGQYTLRVTWLPRLDTTLQRWLPGLIEAGLICEPRLPDDVEGDQGLHPYELTKAGRLALNPPPPD